MTAVTRFDYPSAIPFVDYEDTAAAIDWLELAFGFRERLRYTDENGVIGHSELQLGDAVIFVANPTPAYRGPRRHAEACDQAREWLATPWVIDGVQIRVDDVDAHAARAQAAGARLLSEPEDQVYGERSYRVEDLEGHRWMFSQWLRDVPPEEWGARVVTSDR